MSDADKELVEEGPSEVPSIGNRMGSGLAASLALHVGVLLLIVLRPPNLMAPLPRADLPGPSCRATDRSNAEAWSWLPAHYVPVADAEPPTAAFGQGAIGRG